MHDDRLRELVAGLLQAHGHSVRTDVRLRGRSGVDYEVPLATIDEATILIEFKESPDPVEERDVTFLARMVEDTDAAGAIFIHQGPAMREARRPDLPVALWGPTTLRTQLGDQWFAAHTGNVLQPLVWPDASRRTPLPPSFDPPPSLDTPANDRMEAIDAMEPETDALAGIDDLFGDGLDTFATAEPTTPMATSPAVDGILDFDALDALDVRTAAPTPSMLPPAFQEDAVAQGPLALPARLSSSDAHGVVTDRIQKVERTVLELHPVHLIDYECDLLLDGTLHQETVRGRMQVDGRTKATIEVDPDLVDPSAARPIDWDGDVQERRLRIDEERAMELAHHAVGEAHTRTVEVPGADDASDYEIIERKEVAPDGDQLRLRHRGILWRPAWRLEGPVGSITVDAVSGEVMVDELRSRGSGTIIVD